MGTITILLTKGEHTIIDKEYSYLSKHKWHLNNGGYAARSVCVGGIKKRILLHRLINNTPEGMDTDHINRIKLDNRKANLRTCTRSQNKLNQNPQKNNTSGYTGVFYDKGKKPQYGRWRAQIKINQKFICLGSYQEKEDAINAYRKALVKYI